MILDCGRKGINVFRPSSKTLMQLADSYIKDTSDFCVYIF